MGDELVIEGTTTPKGSSYILKDSLSDSDLLILMDIAKRNRGKKHRSASDIEMGRSPKASIGVESEIPSPSSFVDAMGALCSEIREMNVIQLHVKTTGDLKRCIAQQTGLEPNQQRLLFRGNEKEDREHLHMAAVADVKPEVDKLAEEVANLKGTSKERKVEGVKSDMLSRAYAAIAEVKEKGKGNKSLRAAAPATKKSPAVGGTAPSNPVSWYFCVWFNIIGTLEMLLCNIGIGGLPKASHGSSC
ncbi:hypothetical protein LOK49_LG11G01425 [Camellia lanceoleosa]|uniref:Uncharacterized protein n=1 Tax=Camellia lanceoleosa TaxID=1840588 RepID=A0ACC0G2T4_9ERIC|nr:hypothetical protein LOK49_LG11G01425 [Camellia lanceoleosa]